MQHFSASNYVTDSDGVFPELAPLCSGAFTREGKRWYMSCCSADWLRIRGFSRRPPERIVNIHVT